MNNPVPGSLRKSQARVAVLVLADCLQKPRFFSPHHMLQLVSRTLSRSRHWARGLDLPGQLRTKTLRAARKAWPPCEGDMATQIRQKEWAHTPLGSCASWPEWLKAAVTVTLDCPMPSMLLAGPDLVQIYNDACKPLLGARHPDALGQHFEAGCSQFCPVQEAIVRTVMASGRSVHHQDQKYPVATGAASADRYFTVSYTPVRDTGGRVRGVSVLALETTERVRVAETTAALLQRASLEAHELHSMFEQAAGYMAIVHGGDHVFELASPACRMLFGDHALSGQKLGDLLPPDCDRRLLDILDEAFRTGAPYRNRELCLRSADAPGVTPSCHYVDIECHPIRDGDGAVCGLFVQGHDVTGQIVSTRSMLEAAQQKEEFLATLAHELRNPLAPIINVGSILRHLPADDDKLSHLGDILNRQARHMRRLIDDLLDASRVKKGLLKLNLVEVDLRDVINAAVEQISSPMKQRRHELTLHVDEGPLMVLGDSARLVQVLANLLHNASKYTPPGGEVTLRAFAAADAGQEIAVSDNGIGLDAAFLPHVFEPFTQAERPPGAESGLGLGLALVRSLAELHGGTITASSEGLGHGSTFTLRLPPLAARK